MQKCRYSDIAKCKECNEAFHMQCKKFIRCHLAVLSQQLQPFTFKRQNIRNKVVWSKQINAAKSAALQFAANRNSKIVKLTLSQVISLTISNEVVEGSIFYIECATKAQGDPEKVASVVKSFIDKVALEGSLVSVYVAPSVVLNFDEYQKLC